MPDFEQTILAFERAWQSGSQPCIADFLRGCSQHEARQILHELVCVDLEFRWRHANEKLHRTVADYQAEFPELLANDVQFIELIAEEYRVRQCARNKLPTTVVSTLRCELLQHYSGHIPQLERALAQVDRELANESETFVTNKQSPAAVTCDPVRRPRTFDPRAPLDHRDFVLQGLLGAGYAGKVYRAWQRSLDRYVAIKHLRKGFTGQPWMVDRFLSEARIVARLQHPGIISIHGLGRTPGGGCFIAMELIDGPDLNKRQQSGKIPWRMAVSWMRDVGDAIGHAHQQGIIHCDLKPANLLLGPDGRIHVTDFGMAISTEPTVNRAALGGTAAFMAPEQITDAWGAIGPATDVYGAGAVLFALLTGKPPWSGKRLADILANVIRPDPVTFPRTCVDKLPTAVKNVCLRCLQKSPLARFASMDELRQTLRAAVE